MIEQGSDRAIRMEGFEEYIRERRQVVDAALDRYLPAAAAAPAVVHKAMRYSTLNGGKRLRPILVLAACEAVGGSAENAIPAACAIECIHSFSLIHDDLPCMDDDDFRRGKPTAHKVFGEAIALLAGDALFALAFQLISQTPTGVPRETVLDVWRLVAAAAGTGGMVGGQVMDMQAQGTQVDLAQVEQIHRLKTGVLIQSSTAAGGMLGLGSEEQVNALSAYGENIGIAFQIVDDILDLEGDAVKLGKPVGSDVRMAKATYPSVVGIERSHELAREAIDRAVNALSAFDDRAEPLRLLARFIIDRQA